MRRFVLSLGLAASSFGAAAVFTSAQDAPGLTGEAATLFRRLDSNGDGKLTKAEARPNDRRLFDRIFEMAGKQEGGSVSPAEFQKVFDQNRGGGRPSERPPGRPTEARPGESRPGNGPEGRQPDAKDARPDPDRKTPPNRPETNRPENSRASDRSNAERPNAEPPNRGRGNSRSSERSATTAAEGAAKSAGRSSANRLAGVWRGWVVDGRGENPNAGHMQMELSVEGDRMTAREIGRGGGNRGSDMLGSGTFVVSADANRGNLDATGTSGQYDGVEYLGSFELEGDTLRWCVGNRGKPRPREFATGRGNYLMILRRDAR